MLTMQVVSVTDVTKVTRQNCKFVWSLNDFRRTTILFRYSYILPSVQVVKKRFKCLVQIGNIDPLLNGLSCQLKHLKR